MLRRTKSVSKLDSPRNLVPLFTFQARYDAQFCWLYLRSKQVTQTDNTIESYEGKVTSKWLALCKLSAVAFNWEFKYS